MCVCCGLYVSQPPSTESKMHISIYKRHANCYNIQHMNNMTNHEHLQMMTLILRAPLWAGRPMMDLWLLQVCENGGGEWHGI